MSYKIRNTIALGVIFLLVIGVGIYLTMFFQPKKIKKTLDEVKKIEKQLQDNTAQLRAIAAMQNTLRETLHRWNNRTKEIPEMDLSSQTYGYLSDIINESGAEYLRMNMTYKGKKDAGKVSYNTYSLSGVSEFPNIFRFIWLIENGRKLYKINTLSLQSQEVLNEQTGNTIIKLNYNMDLQAYYSVTEKALSMQVMKPDSTPQPITGNPFQPAVLTKSPPNVRNLLNIEKISVKATSKEKALVMTDEGRLITLKIGDEVYLGKVSAIRPETSEVEFTLNDGGIISVRKKKIQFDNLKNKVY